MAAKKHEANRAFQLPNAGTRGRNKDVSSAIGVSEQKESVLVPGVLVLALVCFFVH